MSTTKASCACSSSRRSIALLRSFVFCSMALSYAFPLRMGDPRRIMSTLFTRIKSLNVSTPSIIVKSSIMISHLAVFSLRPVSLCDSLMVMTSRSTVCRSPARVTSSMNPTLTSEWRLPPSFFWQCNQSSSKDYRVNFCVEGFFQHQIDEVNEGLLKTVICGSRHKVSDVLWGYAIRSTRRSQWKRSKCLQEIFLAYLKCLKARIVTRVRYDASISSGIRVFL